MTGVEARVIVRVGVRSNILSSTAGIDVGALSEKRRLDGCEVAEEGERDDILSKRLQWQRQKHVVIINLNNIHCARPCFYT